MCDTINMIEWLQIIFIAFKIEIGFPERKLFDESFMLINFIVCSLLLTMIVMLN